MQPHPSDTPKPGLHQTLHPRIHAAVSALTTAGTIASGRTPVRALQRVNTLPDVHHHSPKSPCPWLVTWTAAELAAWTE